MTAPVLIVAATSARMLAESARRGGFRPIALDVFGDIDTRRAAHWIGIGNRARSAIDPQRVHAVLERLARQPRLVGWVAGGGFEDRLDLLQDCARTSTLIGNEPAIVATAKQPTDFFRILDRHGIAHPDTSFTRPASPAGWLAKRVGGTGGWHVRRLPEDEQGGSESGQADHRRADREQPDSRQAKAAAVDRHAPRRTRGSRAVYFQREEAGQPMSALFLANGVDAVIVGCNLLLTGCVGERSFVFQGAVGPVVLPASAARAVRHAVACVARHLELRGLNSLDFLLEGERVSVIEVNPRPSATMELHDHRLPGGLVNAHLSACSQRVLPLELPVTDAPVRGIHVIYARQRVILSRRNCQRLQSLGWCHDIGREGTRSGLGDPLCTISCEAESTAAAIAELARRASEVESIHEDQNER